MQRFRHISKEWLLLIIIAILVLVIGILDWNKKPDESDSPAIPVQKTFSIEKEEGNVTVAVEYLQEQSDKQFMTFKIALDTHSVNLDVFDFQKDIVLEKDGQNNTPTSVNQSGSNHHRSAEISFPATSSPFSIILTNLSGIKRREFEFDKLK